MTRIQKILKELDHLDVIELEMILRAIYKRVDQEQRIKSILNEYKGVGAGVWKQDAQQYIDKERDQDRA